METQAHQEGRLSARPRAPGSPPPPPGLHALDLGTPPRGALLYVPLGYLPERPAPLTLMLHGAGGSGAGVLAPLRTWADEAGLLVLAPDSLGPTWDLVREDFGADVARLDVALAQVFSRCAVDPERLACAGFSDGASYALSLGLTNGDLFTHVLAFSPGFMAPGAAHGRPLIYVSHGTQDRVLPLEKCSRRLVPRLRAAGHEVQYVEFEGPHTVPPERGREALALLLEGGPRPAAGQAGS